MTIHSYLLFVGACVMLVITPGPDMMYMLGRCIAQGRRAGYVAAIGFSVGAYCHLLAVILGLSAILATSALAFALVKWIGAAYLIYLGVITLRNASNAVAVSVDNDVRGLRTIFWQAFWSDVLNPKVALFFMALLPQFVDARSEDRVAQFLQLGVTLNVIGVGFNMLIAMFSSRITESLRRDAVSKVILRGLLGVLFIGLGLRLAAEKL